MNKTELFVVIDNGYAFVISITVNTLTTAKELIEGKLNINFTINS